MQPILEVKNLNVSFHVRGGEVKAVRGVNFHVNKGEAVAIVGESGCGKSVTAQTIMRLLPTPPSFIKEGSVIFNGEDLLKKSEKEMESIRGKDIGMIFQDPMTSLNPTITIGKQITEGLIKHQNVSKKDAYARAIEMLNLVGIPNPDARFSQYPHEFSGGMRQRAMIAIALACNPALLIADEPTTALDVTIQAQILDVMKDLQKRLGISIILITHDLGVVADMCDRVVVMYAGKVVETGTKWEIFQNPSHPYTRGLLRSMPRLDQRKDEQLIPIHGTPPDLIKPPAGCAFCARCDDAMRICETQDPAITQLSESHASRCWLLHPMAKEVRA
ncbi:peptide ABC transporter ATP-binding protein [Paenibacillus selenitireducens]|jgi:oligopeptide transport system ATP-binding protein|uniref:Peptide ABC transporter ATP-binding protein n=1 Tax=Paenibacillus selenitireducens TaxID=1324314 RepID=A0A1T2XF68_9BACL|nr:ABC transporter ATP-binding protein [Paenibacillus selenitireducens]OPA78452.1 peptide ABC transporter ATP-binding protein [Paenibacillus selenitireducens]